MSWSRRRVLSQALVPAVAALGGCGFRPMYGGRAGRETAAELGSIEVEPVRDRVAQVLRNHLIDRLSPHGAPQPPRYRLRLDVTSSTEALAIQPDETITRYNLRLVVRFTLIDAASGEELYRDRTRVIGSYNAVRSDFATLAARQDTAERAARAASEEVRTLLSIFFARRAAS